MKKYENPMLQVVSIKKSDIVTASPNDILLGGSYGGSLPICAPGQRGFDEWYEGY